MAAHLQYAVAVFGLAWLATELVARVDPQDAWAPLTALFAPANALLWGVVVVDASIASVWTLDVSEPVAMAIGLCLAGAGGAILLARARRVEPSMGSDGVLAGAAHAARSMVGVGLVLVGIAAAGRSGFGLALTALFGVVAWRGKALDPPQPHAA